MTITKECIKQYRAYLQNEEKAAATVEKYLHDTARFAMWLLDRGLDKGAVLSYKSALMNCYAPASVNAALSSLNRFFLFLERYDLRIKSIHMQKKAFSSRRTELTKAEYARLLSVAKQKKNRRLYLLMQTVCTTGIRISELSFITVSAVYSGIAEVHCKGKLRQILLPKALCTILKQYAKEQSIKSGAIFITKKGNPLDRSNVWSDMKKLCAAANVPREKVFPHNLRHLFARTYYAKEKDIVRLSDLLGHSSINTTRIYTMESGDVHRRQIERLGLLHIEAEKNKQSPQKSSFPSGCASEFIHTKHRAQSITTS